MPIVCCFKGSHISLTDQDTVNQNNGRTGKDANTILASIHTFDPSLRCDAMTFQPCSHKALANHKQVVDSFRFYNINKGIPEGSPIAIGRYSEDVYYEGNAWYLNTLAAAEQLYDAIHVWKDEGTITVSPVSLPFFRDLLPTIPPGSYDKESYTYDTLIEAISNYADGFIDVVAKYAASNGSLAEQFDKNDGTPLSARDLTWSYASFLTATARRAGIMPPSWADDSTNSVPKHCQGTSIIGSYSSATVTTFPPSQTPIKGPLPPPSTTSCSVAASATVIFHGLVKTQYGEAIKIVGNIEALGDWDPEKAVPLRASEYTSHNPLWKAVIPLKVGQVIEYKYINVKKDGSVKWEGDPNHTYTIPCAPTATKVDKWQR